MRARIVNRRGFTLIEMVFVVTTIALVGAIALPRFAGASDRRRLLAAGERTVADIAMLREQARAISGTVTVRFARAGYAWDSSAGGVAGASGRTTLNESPYFVTLRFFQSGGDDTVVFDGYGASDATLRLILGTGDYRMDYDMPKIVSAEGLGAVRLAAFGEE